MTPESSSSAARFFGIALVISLLASCVSKVPVPQSFWQNKQARVAIAVTTGAGRGQFFKEGNQGILDIAINSAMTMGADKALSNLKPDTFRRLKGRFISELHKRGFETVELKNDLKFSDFSRIKGADGYNWSKDFSQTLSTYKADYLIILSLNGYGSIRPYYGFIPLGGPSGYANASGFMIQKDGKKPVWNTGHGTPSRSEIQGEWDQRPEYKNLVQAADRAIDNAGNNLVTEFFN